MIEPINISCEDFEKVKSLGKGTFGHVYLARMNGEDIALKMLFKRKYKRCTFHWSDEIEIHAHLGEHPNIAKFFGWFEDETRVFIIMEYFCGNEVGDLYDLSGEDAKFVVRSVACALDHMEMKGVRHCDIKSENVLLNEDRDRCVVVDLGHAVLLEEMRNKSALRGSHVSIPPEALTNNIIHGSIDRWQLGVLAFDLVMDRLPFGEADAEVDDIYAAIKKCEISFGRTSVDPAARNFIERLLVLDPTKRMGMFDILSHPWIKS